MEVLIIGLMALAGLVIGLITAIRGNGWGFALAALAALAFGLAIGNGWGYALAALAAVAGLIAFVRAIAN